MKQIKLLLLAVVLLVFPFVNASPDLIVKDIEVWGEPIAMTPLSYRIYIQNVGDEPVESRLAVRVWTNTDAPDVRGSWYSLVGLTDSVMVQMEDGGIRYEVPIEGDVFLPGQEVPIRTPTITLNPGETAIFDSETPVVNYSISFYLSERSLNGSAGYIESEIDPHNEVNESNEENNIFHKDVVVRGGILEGPYDGSRGIPSLDAGEYFIFGQGCANLREKRVCAGDETIDGEDVIIVSVDGEERTINRFSPLYRWIIRLLDEGRESPYVNIGGVRISLYTHGFKITF